MPRRVPQRKNGINQMNFGFSLPVQEQRSRVLPGNGLNKTPSVANGGSSSKRSFSKGALNGSNGGADGVSSKARGIPANYRTLLQDYLGAKERHHGQAPTFDAWLMERERELVCSARESIKIGEHEVGEEASIEAERTRLIIEWRKAQRAKLKTQRSQQKVLQPKQWVSRPHRELQQEQSFRTSPEYQEEHERFGEADKPMGLERGKSFIKKMFKVVDAASGPKLPEEQLLEAALAKRFPENLSTIFKEQCRVWTEERDRAIRRGHKYINFSSWAGGQVGKMVPMEKILSDEVISLTKAASWQSRVPLEELTPKLIELQNKIQALKLISQYNF
ncbi:MAG: hypothetical protein NTY48_05445 [Candidatus Diapherotrites archaeon]|nr:hypothetical protein [Candidatus Diapherotrites archaeon]